MSEAFARLGHEVVLFGFRSARRSEDVHAFYDIDPTFRILRFPRLRVRGIGMALFARRVHGACRKMGPPDLFVSREAYSMLACARFGVPFVYEAHVAPHSAVKRALEQRLFGRPNFLGLVTNCNALREYYLRTFPALDAARTLNAPSAARTPQRYRAPSETGRDRSRLQVGYVGRLAETRGIEIILELAARNPDMDFHLLGGRAGEAEAWRRKVSVPNVEFPGFVAPRELEEWYGRFDVVVAPYASRVISRDHKWDLTPWMSPLKVVEAMAYGKALVCSDFPVLREFLTHAVNAWLVAPDDLAGWNDALRTLRDNPPVREDLGAQARSDFLAGHTYDGRARRVLDFIRRRMGQSGR
jgi:glycosyltransferase involved in cell wall biosynthesis